MNEKLIRNGVQVLGILVTVVVFSGSLVAQDVEITNEELNIYAEGMIMVDSVKDVVSAEYRQLIMDNTVLKGRFNKIKNAYGDEAKLTEIEATPEEITAYGEIQEAYAIMKSDLNATSTEIIKGDIGAEIYKKVKKVLKIDAELKTKYETIFESLKSEEGEDGDA